MAGKYQPYSPYSYVLGNPVSLVDPDGRSACPPGEDCGGDNPLTRAVDKTKQVLGDMGNAFVKTVGLVASFTDADDITVLASTLTGNPVHTTGEQADGVDVTLAALGLFMPYVSGGAMGKAGKRLVYTATDDAVDLNRAGSGVKGSSESFGGTYVTEVDITEPRNLAEHTRQNIPPSFSRDGPYPSTISTIEVPENGLRADPSVPNPSPGTFWIPPNTPGARVVQEHNVVGETDDFLPIIKRKE